MNDTVPGIVHINSRFATEKISIAIFYCNKIFTDATYKNYITSDETDYEKKAALNGQK